MRVVFSAFTSRYRLGRIVTGFYAGRTHTIVPGTECAIGVPENKQILELILDFMEKHGIAPYDETTGKGLLRHALIRKGFREFIPETTKIIIAQRISSIEDADLILVMDGGVVSAMGTHEQLLQTCEIYQEIYESQVKGGGDFDQPA